VRQQTSDDLLQLQKADFDFDAWLALLRDDQILEVGRNTNFLLHPAHYWTHVAGRQSVDFIGRVERFEEDFGRLLGALGSSPRAVGTWPPATAVPTTAPCARMPPSARSR